MMDTIQTLGSARIDDREIIFAGRNTGLYRMDVLSGTSVSAWAALADDFRLPVTALKVTVPCLIAGVPGGILRSNDNGTTWDITQFQEPAPIPTAICVAGDNVLVSTLEDGVFVSSVTDGDLHPRNYGLFDPSVLALTSSPLGIVFAGTSSGLFLSENGGQSWKGSVFSPPSPILCLAVDGGSHLLIGTESDGLWRWDWKTEDAPVCSYACSEPVNALAMSDGTNMDYAAVAGRLLASSNPGENWVLVRSFPIDISAICLSVLSRSADVVWIGVEQEIVRHSMTG